MGFSQLMPPPPPYLTLPWLEQCIPIAGEARFSFPWGSIKNWGWGVGKGIERQLLLN